MNKRINKCEIRVASKDCNPDFISKYINEKENKASKFILHIFLKPSLRHRGLQKAL